MPTAMAGDANGLVFACFELEAADFLWARFDRRDSAPVLTWSAALPPLHELRTCGCQVVGIGNGFGVVVDAATSATIHQIGA